ncbi:MAG: hypothetical protein R3C44_13090 [Chloroflexota bacterium]
MISRGQLVEIGGGFRILTLAQSGAKLAEVGTTNRTLTYAITRRRSTKIRPPFWSPTIQQGNGFTYQPELGELARLAHEAGIYILYDQGSGKALVDVSSYGLDPEPTVPDGLEAGCDVVAFSGDKLLADRRQGPGVKDTH